MKSCLYECKVKHHRSLPRAHRFEYGVFFFCIDLDEVDDITHSLWLVKKNRPGIYSFFEEDYMSDLRSSCKGKVLSYVAGLNNQLATKISQVKLLTGLRVLGYIFNPVSIYYCLDSEGVLLCAVAEVTNTFREAKLYLVCKQSDADESQVLKEKLAKLFYVSPFSNLDTFFEFTIPDAQEKLLLSINTIENDATTLASTVVGKRVPLTSAQLIRLTFSYPLMSLRTISLIHLHALMLFLKGIPFIRKETNPHLQTEVKKPHKSLTGGFKSSAQSVFFASQSSSDIDKTAS